MFYGDLGVFGYAGPAEACPPSLSPAARAACLQNYRKRQQSSKLKKAMRKAKAQDKAKKKAFRAKVAKGLPGLAASAASARWTPLKTWVGVSPSTQNDNYVASAFQFFRQQGLSFQQATAKAIQGVRVPSRWQSHYRLFLQQRYGEKKAKRSVRRKKIMGPRRRTMRSGFQPSRASQAAASVSSYEAEQIPVSEEIFSEAVAISAAEPAIRQGMMRTPQEMQVDAAAEEFAVYEEEPFYTQPAFLVGAGLLAAAGLYFYTQKDKKGKK